MRKECKTLSVDLSAYFDGELEGEALQHVERHLDGCGDCQASLAKLRRLRDAMSAMASPGPRRRVSVLEALRSRLEDEEDARGQDPDLPC